MKTRQRCVSGNVGKNESYENDISENNKTSFCVRQHKQKQNGKVSTDELNFEREKTVEPEENCLDLDEPKI